MLLAAEVFSKPEYKLPADEARKYVDELQRARRERLDGLKRLEIARTGPVKHVGTAFVLAPDADTQARSRVLPTNSIRISAGRARSPQKTRSLKRWSRKASPRTESSGSAI